MESLNLNTLLNYKHMELFQSTAPELCVRGGANAGKSYSIADKLLLQPRIQPDKKLEALVVRKTLPSLKSSTLNILEKRAEVHKIPFELNKNENIARCENLKIWFKSMNNKEDFIAIKSMTDIDFVWANEITDLREFDFDMLSMRIRGGQSSFNQFMFDFNPVGKTSWIYKRFYENGNGKTHKLCYTVLDNPWASEEEIAKLRAYKEADENLYNIYFKGKWGELEGIIFSWDFDSLPDNPDEVFYGLDFGYSVDPAAVVRIYRKADEFWIEEVIYEKELTNQMLAQEMKARGVDRSAEIYADAAEPKSIEELHREGLNVKPCKKGPDSVRAGVDYLKTLKIHIVDGSEMIAREQKAYIWKKDKDGHSLNVPIESDNHAMDAIRYGIYTHCKKKSFGVGVM